MHNFSIFILIVMKWKDLTIEKFLKINPIIEDKSLNGVERRIQLVSALEDISIAEVEQMTIEQYNKIAGRYQFLLEKPSEQPTKYFTLNGTEYEIEYEVKNLTGGQYISIMTYLKDGEMGAFDNMAKIIAVLTKEKGKKYDEAKFPEMANLFYKELTMDIVYPVAIFFLNLWKSLIEAILTSLSKTQKEVVRELRDLLKSGDGLQSLTPSQVETLLNGMK